MKMNEEKREKFLTCLTVLGILFVILIFYIISINITKNNDYHYYECMVLQKNYVIEDGNRGESGTFEVTILDRDTGNTTTIEVEIEKYNSYQINDIIIVFLDEDYWEED